MWLQYDTLFVQEWEVSYARINIRLLTVPRCLM